MSAHTGSIACLAVPSLAMTCALLGRPQLAQRVLALTESPATHVLEATAAARALGIRPGMTIRDAVAICPSLSVIESRAADIARYAEGLIEAMAGVSPLVEPVEPGTVLADLRGTEALYPRVEDLHRAVGAATPLDLGDLQPRLGIAGRRLTAMVAAQRAEPGGVLHVTDTEAADFLAEEPVEVLPLELDQIERLRLLGLETCGRFAALPRHAVEAQFGFEGGVAWLAARGEDPRSVRSRPWERERVVEQVQCEPPLVSREAILHGLEQMLGRALRHPRARHRFVRLLRVRGETERGALWEREQVLREPLGDRARLWTVLRSLVEYADFPGPLGLISLELSGLTAESGRQYSLFAEQTRRREQLDEMVRHLKVRFGESPVARVVAVEPWHRLPERRYALLEYDP